MKMSLTSALMDVWLYIVIRGLILSGGPHCAALLNQEVFRERFSANDRCAAQAFFFPPYPSIQNRATLSKTQQKKKTWPCMHAGVKKKKNILPSNSMTPLCEDVHELGSVA